MLSLGGDPACAEDTTATTADRLGFHFDQQAHDAAQKKSSAPRSLENEPAPAGVERLPRYVVREKGVPLEDHDILSPKGRDAVAKERYLSPLYQKTFGPLAAIAGLLANPLGGWHPNSPEAGVLYDQDESRRRASEESDLRDLASLADSAKATPTASATSQDKGKH